MPILELLDLMTDLNGDSEQNLLVPKQAALK
jgi:hypothetical protein